MKKHLFLSVLITCLVLASDAQTYLINNGGTHYTCSGTMYDSGGAGANYSNNESDTITICANPGNRLKVLFSAVDIHSSDKLVVYYGSSPTGTPATSTPSTGLVINSSCDCMTFVFNSDGSTTRAGWTMQIACDPPTTVSNNLIYYPNVPPLDGTCLTGQTNVNANVTRPAFGCFSGLRPVFYDVTPDAGNNTLEVTMQNSTFGDGQVQYILYYGECPNYVPVSAQCGPVGDTYTWTNLTEDHYILGVSTTTAANQGTFDLCVTQSWVDICGDYVCGPTEDCSTCAQDCGLCPEAIGGPYFHPVVGLAGFLTGRCMVNTCTGRYYDDGGSGATYSNNVTNISRTFCPDQPLKAIRAQVNVLDLEYLGGSCIDGLFVYNGPSDLSPNIWTGCGKSSIPNIVTASGVYGIGVFTSTHVSGCLTFKFRSNASNPVYWEGWDISLSCIDFPSGPEDTHNNDCTNAIAICDDYTVASEVWGPGLHSDACQGGCIVSENYADWFWFRMATGGTLELEVNPVGNSNNDFSLFKADDCDSLGAPVRCSSAKMSPPGKTGLRDGELDVSEGYNGDQWVAKINVLAGETYYIMVNETHKINPNTYHLDWTLTNGATFDCTILSLPVNLLDFNAECGEHSTTVSWSTASEHNNSYFTLERSFNGLNFYPVTTIQGAGFSNNLLKYFYEDMRYTNTVYYRLKQTDYDGKTTTSEVISATCGDDRQFNLTIGDNSDDGFIEIIHDAVLDIQYLLTIIDAQGRCIYSEQYTSSSQLISKKVETQSFASGIYFVNISSTVNNHSKKIMLK
jgi:hypothetical protein